MTKGSLIETLYTECDGYLDLRALKAGGKPKQRLVRLGDWAQLKAFLHEHRDHDLYFGIATRDKGGGKKENIVHIPAVFIDQDFKTIPGGEQEAQRILESFPLQPTIIVKSGGGNHLYWKLKEPSDKVDIERCEAIMKGLSARLHGDMAATDASRILRIPHTLNHKYKPPRKVIMVHCNGTEFSLSDFDDFLDYDPEISKVQCANTSQNSNLMRVMCCKFMEHCRDDAAALPEPEWRAMITQLMREVGGISLIHQLSKPYPRYKKSETDKKIQHALDTTGPHTCDSIKLLWDCGLDCGVKSPAGLAYRLTEMHLRNATDATEATSATNAQNATGCNWNATEMQLGMQLASNSQTITTVNLTSNVKDWLDLCDGVFSIEDVARELQLYKNTSAYNTLRSILKRLVDTQVIERVGEKRGVYRRIENDLDEMRWWEASTDEYNINLPLGLSSLCRIYPKNIIIIAGENNAAKTLLSLYIAKANAELHEVRFFNSETDPVELRNRLLSFNDTCMEDWQKIHFYSRSSNFHQCIFPNDLNIIDFLEIHDEYYKVGGWIRQIHDRLDKGIAVINLQKKPGCDTGRGGEVTTEKARLYLSLMKSTDHLGYPITRAKIVKCKAPRDPRSHPYGMVREFRIHRGWDIEPISQWQPEKQENQSATRPPR